MDNQSLRVISKKEWAHSGENPSIQDIELGALLRIADSTEKMAVNHAELIRSRDMYKGFYEQARLTLKLRDRQIAALRGHLSRAKRKQERSALVNAEVTP